MALGLEEISRIELRSNNQTLDPGRRLLDWAYTLFDRHGAGLSGRAIQFGPIAQLVRAHA